MTYQEDFTLPNELLEQVGKPGLDFIFELERTIINRTMQAEPPLQIDELMTLVEVALQTFISP